MADRESAMLLKMEKEKKARERKDRMKELEKLAQLKAKKSDSEVCIYMNLKTYTS
jgi:hypothetical protein